MYTAVFKKVWIEDNDTFNDISDQIGMLKYKRDVEKDDEVSFTVEQPYISNLSNNVLRRGQTIRYQYGYKGGQKSPVYRARVTDIARKYAKTVSMTIKARDLGSVMKKSTSIQIWDGVTLSDIAKEIANSYQLEYEGDETTQVYNNYPQSQKDDLSFLRELALREKDGNYNVYVTDKKLILERRGMNQPSALTFEYGRDQRVIMFSVRTKESTKHAQVSASANLTGFNPETGEIIGEATTSETEENGVNLGENEYTFSANGELIENPVLSQTQIEGIATVAELATRDARNILNELFPEDKKFGSTIVTPYEEPTEIRNISNSQRKSSKLKTTEARLKVTGTPNMKLNSVVTMAGVEKVDLGNYLVVSIVDTISSGGYTTEMTMNKNASKRRNKPTDVTNTEKANTTTGDSVIQNTTTLQVFDANGQLTTNSTSEYKPPK